MIPSIFVILRENRTRNIEL